ncbi:hypothetical protein MRB53_028703 [Persea americana]|uniref:Uncharacterized protein n=1 Tax=Persea americana TaxID=3435 RepID=A0ACC2KGT2_PERAE|nr:hypothetical protein MRB53_028703 [Persea americana]
MQCETIIEEPTTPKPQCLDSLESAIEDAFWTEDPDEIPMIKLNVKEFMQNIQNYMQEKGELQDVDMSKALVALIQEAATIPMPKLKNINMPNYELPDTHPLLAKLDRREPDDKCAYLLAIWTPGETAQSIQPPEIDCTSQNSGNICSKKTCFTCNNMRGANAQTVRGVLMRKIAGDTQRQSPATHSGEFCFLLSRTEPGSSFPSNNNVLRSLQQQAQSSPPVPLRAHVGLPACLLPRFATECRKKNLAVFFFLSGSGISAQQHNYFPVNTNRNRDASVFAFLLQEQAFNLRPTLINSQTENRSAFPSPREPWATEDQSDPLSSP